MDKGDLSIVGANPGFGINQSHPGLTQTVQLSFNIRDRKADMM